jgi:hypothetical protein
MKAAYASLAAATLCSFAVHAAGPDILIADFEGRDYGAWKTTGEAFGAGPAQGTLKASPVVFQAP